MFLDEKLLVCCRISKEKLNSAMTSSVIMGRRPIGQFGIVQKSVPQTNN